MRLRNIPAARGIIENSPLVIHNGVDFNGKWDSFTGDKPLFLEIGTGKGRFIMDMSLKYPGRFFLGVERYESVLYKAIGKLEERETEGNDISNIRFLCMDAFLLPELFSEGEVDGIFLNFPDPWPKKRHAHRRLLHRRFLESYRRYLKNHGVLQLKTDNTGLFEFGLEELRDTGWNILETNYDLHKDGSNPDWNIYTEYEQKFSDRGNPIFLLRAKP